MIQRLKYTSVVALTLASVFVGGRADAQFNSYGPPQNPLGTQSFSPYLNMMRSGTSGAINYYGLVRPQMQGAQQIQNLQQQTQVLEQQQAFGTATTGVTNTTPLTGHAAQFQSYSHYFPTMGMSGSGTSALGGSLGGQPAHKVISA